MLTLLYVIGVLLIAWLLHVPSTRFDNMYKKEGKFDRWKITALWPKNKNNDRKKRQ